MSVIARSIAIVVEISVDGLGHLIGNTLYGLQIHQGGLSYGFGCAEMVEQGTLSCWPDTRDILKPGLRYLL